MRRHPVATPLSQAAPRLLPTRSGSGSVLLNFNIKIFRGALFPWCKCFKFVANGVGRSEVVNSMLPRTILLVDDDTQHLKLHALVLKKAGYRPITTVVGSASFGMHQNENPSLIFLDYRLNSSLSARQVAGVLKEAFPHTPLVVLSGLDTLPPDMQGLADDFLRKGEPEDLVAMADKLLKPNTATSE